MRKEIIFLFLLLLTFIVRAQQCPVDHTWEKTNPGGGGWFGCVGASLNGVILAGSDLSGAYRSTDGGQSWDVCGQNKGFNETHVSGLGFHKTDPNIMFLAGGGIYKSVDEGNSWNKVLDTSINSSIRGYITDIEFGTNQSNVGYASWHGGNWNTTNAQIFKSTNDGDTWVQVSTNLPQTRIIKIEVNPQDANEVFLLTGKGRPVCATADVYRSTDGGVTWTNLTASETFEGFTEVADVAIHPTNSDILYVNTRDANCSNSGYYNGLESKTFKSIDGGQSWSKILDFGGLIFVDPVNPEKVTLIETRVVAPWNPRSGTRVSLDGGASFTKISDVATWETVFHGITQYTYGGTRDGYARTIAQDLSNSDNFYWINSQWVTGSSDGGTSFQVLHGEEETPGLWQSNGADNIVNLDMTISLANPNIIYLGLADMGIWRSLNQGDIWESCNTESTQYGWGQGRGGNVPSVLADPSRQETVWITVEKGYILRSDDKGEASSWVESNSGITNTSHLNGLSLDPNSTESNRTLYVTANGDVYKSTDDGYSWSSKLSNQNCLFTAVDQFDSNVLYAGGTKGLWRSQDQGDSWTRLTTLSDLPPDNANLDLRSNAYKGIFDIQTDPHNANSLYVTVFGGGQERGLYHSTDAGENWTKILSDKYMRKVTIAPNNENIMYATSSSALNSGGLKEGSNGIWFSNDKGQSWTIQNQEMAYPFANTVEITNESNPIVFVGSPGTGFQKASVPINEVTANCQTITVALDASGNAVITAQDLDNGSTSTCDSTMSIDIDTFTCDDIGTNDVVLTITDLDGNTSSCTTAVIVEDTMEPTIDSCVEDTSVFVDSGESYSIPDYSNQITYSDNCDATLAYSQMPAAGTLVTSGTVTTISITIEDSSNNVDSCNFLLSVEESLGLDQNEKEKLISIYPNPSSDIVNVRYTGDESLEFLSLFDLLGKKIFQKSNITSQEALSIALFPSGIYFLRVTTTESTFLKKIIIQR